MKIVDVSFLPFKPTCICIPETHFFQGGGHGKSTSNFPCSSTPWHAHVQSLTLKDLTKEPVGGKLDCMLAYLSDIWKEWCLLKMQRFFKSSTFCLHYAVSINLYYSICCDWLTFGFHLYPHNIIVPGLFLILWCIGDFSICYRYAGYLLPSAGLHSSLHCSSHFLSHFCSLVISVSYVVMKTVGSKVSNKSNRCLMMRVATYSAI